MVLPRLGRLKLHESARKLARRLEAGTARIVSATVRRDGGRWFVAFCVGVDRAARTPARPEAVVGVDLGVTHLAVLSTGEVEPNPRHLDAAARRMRRLAGACLAGWALTGAPAGAGRSGGSGRGPGSVGRMPGSLICAVTVCTS